MLTFTSYVWRKFTSQYPNTSSHKTQSFFFRRQLLSYTHKHGFTYVGKCTIGDVLAYKCSLGDVLAYKCALGDVLEYKCALGDVLAYKCSLGDVLTYKFFSFR
jgi:DNA-binding Xre family transcriptional regulator